jgi:anti-sigma B factor antagonist
MVVSIAPGTNEVRLSGTLDVSTVHDVRLAVHAALDDGAGDLFVDLRDVEMLDATGLGMLVGAHRRAGRAGRRLVLRNLSPQLVRLLRVSRLNRILVVEPAASQNPNLPPPRQP